MKKRIFTFCIAILVAILCCCTAFAADLPRTETPNYRVSFYSFDCFNMQDEDGIRYGYGYDMMQGLSKYLQCTFSYVGYEKTASECEDMLRSGELDIYTAAKRTSEREAEFAFSNHPAITATTCMNVKIDNTKVVAGDYSTYNGLRIGLLERHTYNAKTLDFIKEKGFDCTVVYYETPTELTNALINNEVDAIVNSYMTIPEDERTVENFGDTPYYLMARKEDQALIDAIDKAFDRMNVETPNWRNDLYEEYYGEQALNTEFTDSEIALLEQLQADNTVIKAVMTPDSTPYSSYEEGEAVGIVPDIFRATANELGLSYEILQPKDREEYEALLESETVDIWMDMDGHYGDEGIVKYKLTDPYLTTAVSMLQSRGSYGAINKIAVLDDTSAMQSILTQNWPDAEIIKAESTDECINLITSGQVDGALLMTYTAQMLSRNDVQNRLQSYLVAGASISLRMGVSADIERDFYGLWEKTLATVSAQQQDEIVQSYMEATVTPSIVGMMFDHPAILLTIVCAALLILFLLCISLYAAYNNKKQRQISAQLAVALEEAHEANDAKQNFFSKMSHDIRTPLNVVLGMTQVAQKYKNDTPRLEKALNNISSEGNYLLVLISSILDVNQLEHGRIELEAEPFDPAENLKHSELVLQPLAEKKEQHLSVTIPKEKRIVVGDSGRYSQIIINIVSNAVKYTPAGGMIQVKLKYLPNDIVRFVCTDNGIGMTKEFIAHITEEYARAEDSRTSKVHGTGLGMSVVKGFTDLMHGTLQIESEPGEGSTFVIDIPFTPATEEQIEQLRLAAAKAEEIVEPYAGKRALLAEDNELNAEIAIELLQSIGLTIDWVENGELAVEKLEASTPGQYFAVFMDMQMPVMDGVEATKRIRASSHPDHIIPIFAMTANTFASDRQKCMDAGMTGYIAKPISLNEITSTLQEGITT